MACQAYDRPAFSLLPQASSLTQLAIKLVECEPTVSSGVSVFSSCNCCQNTHYLFS